MKNIRQPFLILAMGLVLLGASYAQDARTLQGITYQMISNRLHVTIKFDGTFSHETFELISPRRLVIDFSPVTKIATTPYFQINELGVLNIRAAQFQPNVVRVVFDLAEKAPPYRIIPVGGEIKVEFWLEQVPTKTEMKTEETKRKLETHQERPSLKKSLNDYQFISLEKIMRPTKPQDLVGFKISTSGNMLGELWWDSKDALKEYNKRDFKFITLTTYAGVLILSRLNEQVELQHGSPQVLVIIPKEKTSDLSFGMSLRSEGHDFKIKGTVILLGKFFTAYPLSLSPLAIVVESIEQNRDE